MIRINPQSMILKFIMIIPVTTLMRPIIPGINKIVVAILLLALLYSNIIKKLYLKDLIVLSLTIVLYIISILNTQEALYNSNDLFYFIQWILFCIYINRNSGAMQSQIKNNIEYIEKVCIFWNIIYFTYLLLGNDIRIMVGPHQLGSAAFYIVVLVWLCVKERKKYILSILMICPIIAIAESQARTYFGLVIVFGVLILYQLCNSIKKFLICIVPFSLICAILLLNSSMMDKWSAATSDGYFDALGMLTSGRSIFWAADINAFISADMLHILFGNGYNFVYDVNYIAIHDYIWAHNDYINILLCYGSIGLFVFLYAFYKMDRAIASHNKILKVIHIGILVLFFINAFFNGLYNYTNATLSIPFVYLSLVQDERER